MKYDSQALTRLADRLLYGKDRFEKLKELGNRGDYTHKVKKLKQRLTEELRFWVAKGPSPRLADIENDIKYISSLLTKEDFTTKEKRRIDELVQKHPIDML